MPIYEYNCSKCGNSFELLIRSKSDLPSKCPKCGSKKITKGFSAFAVSSSDSSFDPKCEACPTAGTGCGGGCGCGM